MLTWGSFLLGLSVVIMVLLVISLTSAIEDARRGSSIIRRSPRREVSNGHSVARAYRYILEDLFFSVGLFGGLDKDNVQEASNA